MLLKGTEKQCVCETRTTITTTTTTTTKTKIEQDINHRQKDTNTTIDTQAKEFSEVGKEFHLFRFVNEDQRTILQKARNEMSSR